MANSHGCHRGGSLDRIGAHQITGGSAIVAASAATNERRYKVIKAYPRKFKLHVVEAADHAFGVLKSSGRGPSDVWQEVAQVTKDFVETVI